MTRMTPSTIYPRAARRGDSPNSSPRTEAVQCFIIHHYAGTTPPDEAWTRFMTSNDRDVCPTWQVNADGSVFECMNPDTRRPWTSGAIDNRAVTVETQNTTGAPHWGISPASHEAIAALVAFAAERYGFPLDRDHVFGHNEAAGAYPTACPGPSMNLDWIVTRARQLTTPTVPKEDNMAIIIRRTTDGTIALVAPGFWNSFTDPGVAGLAAAVWSASDEIHQLDARQFDAMTRSLGIPDDARVAGVWSRDEQTATQLAEIAEAVAKLGHAPGEVDIDEDALAASLAVSLAPLLAENLAVLTDDEIARLAKAAADETDRRDRERLNVTPPA